jgi:hypothetical protein
MARVSIAKKPRTLANMHDAAGLEPHQASTSCVGGNWIVCPYDRAQRSPGAIEWSVAFHRHDPVSNHEMNWSGCAEIENALLDPFPVQDVLRLSVARAGDNPEHVLQGQRHARPVMRLDLRY